VPIVSTLLNPSPRSRSATCSSIAVTLGDRRCEANVESLLARVIAGDHLDLAPFQARGHLEAGKVEAVPLGDPERLGYLRLGDAEQAHRALVDRARVAQGSVERTRAHSVAEHRLKLARRPRKDDDGRPAVRARGRHDEARRGADRLEHGGALGNRRLLAVGLLDRLRIDVGPAFEQRRDDRRDALGERLVEHHRPALKVAHDLGGQVVGGRPEAAARQDYVQLLPGHEVERRPHVLRAIADDRRVRDIDAELAQPLCEPRAVAIADPPRQDLRARHDDAGPRAHLQVGSWPAESVWRPRAFVIE